MGKSYRVFRHNLFYHIGSASTLGQQKRCALPRTPRQPRTRPIPQPRTNPRRAQGRATWRDLPHRQLPRRLARRYTPKCYHHLYDWLLPKEVFNSDDCPDDDVWPCGEARDAKPPFFPATKVRRRRRVIAPIIVILPSVAPPGGTGPCLQVHWAAASYDKSHGRYPTPDDRVYQVQRIESLHEER